MNSSRTPRSSLQAPSARLRNSGPLSRTMASGSPRSLAIRSSTRRTRNPPSEVSTSMAGHSRVQPSTMVNIRITLPVATQSLTKSIDQRSFGRVAAGLVTAPPSGSAAVAESSSPNLPRGRAGTRACGWSAFLPAPASPSAADTRNACAAPLVFSSALAVRCPAPLFAPDSDASFVPIPSACRRAARSSGTRPRRSSRLPEVLQALPVFCEHVFQRPVIQRQLGHHVLQLPVLVFQLLQPLGLAAVHPAVLRLPAVVSLLADPVLPA